MSIALFSKMQILFQLIFFSYWLEQLQACQTVPEHGEYASFIIPLKKKKKRKKKIYIYIYIYERAD